MPGEPAGRESTRRCEREAERERERDRQSRAVTHRKPSSLKLATSSSDADQNEAEEDSVASAIVTRCDAG
jgi:hypothetical protein